MTKMDVDELAAVGLFFVAVAVTAFVCWISVLLIEMIQPISETTRLLIVCGIFLGAAIRVTLWLKPWIDDYSEIED